MPRDAVNEDKQKHIYKCTKYYLHMHGLDNAYVRFDVIEIYFLKNKSWFEEYVVLKKFVI